MGHEEDENQAVNDGVQNTSIHGRTFTVEMSENTVGHLICSRSREKEENQSSCKQIVHFIAGRPHFFIRGGVNYFFLKSFFVFPYLVVVMLTTIFEVLSTVWHFCQDLLNESPSLYFWAGVFCTIWMIPAMLVSTIKNTTNTFEAATVYMIEHLQEILRVEKRKEENFKDFNRSANFSRDLIHREFSTLELHELIQKGKEYDTQIRIKLLKDVYFWDEPLYVVFNSSHWNFEWATFYFEGTTNNKSFAMQASVPQSTYVMLDVPYEKVSFIQNPENKTMFFCFYGKYMIGYYKLKGSKRGNKRSPSWVLDNICTNENVWLISLKAFKTVCDMLYNEHTFNDRVNANADIDGYVICDCSNCLERRQNKELEQVRKGETLRDLKRKQMQNEHKGKATFFSNSLFVESEKRELILGHNLPYQAFSSMVNVMFKCFVYQCISRRFEYFYGGEIMTEVLWMESIAGNKLDRVRRHFDLCPVGKEMASELENSDYKADL